MRGFLETLEQGGRARLAWVIGVQVAAALAQALGILLLVPLLGTVDVSVSSGITDRARDVFDTFGVELTLGSVLALYVAVVSAAAALTAFHTVLATRYRLEIVDRLRERLYRAVSGAEWSHLLRRRHSDLLSALTVNVPWVAQGVLGAMAIASVAVLATAQLAAAAAISPSASGLAVASGVVLLAVVWPLVRRSRRLGDELVEGNRDMVGIATGFLDGLKLAKAHGREDAHIVPFARTVQRAREAQIDFARSSALAHAIQVTLTALLLAVTVALAVRALDVPIGSLLVIVFVFARLVSHLTTAQQHIQLLAQALPAHDELATLIAELEAAAEAGSGTGADPPRERIGSGVRLEEVHFRYPPRGAEEGGAEAVRGVSIELPAGSAAALVGPSGSGKTTLADLAAGLISPSAGEVLVDGRPLTGDRIAGWRKSVAFVPQEPFLFHDTLGANLRWAAPEASDEEIWEALGSAAASDFVQVLPDRLEAVVGDRGSAFSGGERQRLALARALLRKPDLLILDEATSWLDADSENAVHRAIAGLRGSATVLLVTHRPVPADLVDRTYVIDAGRVAQERPPAGAPA